jgi:hypothetical protein
VNPQQRQPTLARARLAALFSAVALVACGGGGDSDTPPPVGVPSPPPAPAPAPVESAFATPVSATATSESGAIDKYSYAEKGGELTAGELTYDSGAVGYSVTLAAAQAYAGAAIRYYAPGNTGSAPRTTFDASGFSKLKISLASTTDATLTIKLQPNPLSGDGCTATATALVTGTMAELVIDLDDESFPLPGHCSAGTALDAVKTGLYAIDVINGATTAGQHALQVAGVTFVE